MGTQDFDRFGQRRHEKGFTLIEILIAICILSVGLLGVASMQGSASRNNVFSDSRTVATTWAADQMETLMAMAMLPSYWVEPPALPPTNDLSDADGDGATGNSDLGFDDDPSTAGDADHGVVQGKYTIYWNVVDNAIPQDPAYPAKTITKTINLIVIWSDYGGNGRISMQRVIPRIS